MAKRKLGGLGKGLDSLFEDLPITEDASPDLTRLPVREIEPDPDQPRKNFDEDAMAALAESIGENGLLQPIAVRAKKTGPGYVIIAGERRWRAARMAGLDEVPVLIKEVTDEQAAALALIENLQREDLDPIEVAEGCKKLIERYGLTQEEAAKRLGKSRSAITNAMRLLNLPEYVRDQVRTGDISAGHAKALLSLGSPEQMSAAADQIIAKDMSVRQAEALCRKMSKPPKPAKEEDAFTRPVLAVEVEGALKETTGSEVHVDYKGGIPPHPLIRGGGHVRGSAQGAAVAVAGHVRHENCHRHWEGIAECQRAHGDELPQGAGLPVKYSRNNQKNCAVASMRLMKQ